MSGQVRNRNPLYNPTVDNSPQGVRASYSGHAVSHTSIDPIESVPEPESKIARSFYHILSRKRADSARVDAVNNYYCSGSEIDINYNYCIFDANDENRLRTTIIAKRGLDVSDNSVKANEKDTKYLPDDKGAHEHQLSSAFSEAVSPADLGALLTACRSAKGITRASIATTMGTSEASVRRIELGLNAPSWDTIQRYAQAIGVKVKILLEDREP